MHGPATPQVESAVLAVLIQLIVIISAARAAGWAFRLLGQPQVCGEIAAGLILGPSVLGRFFPQVSEHIFHASVAPMLNIFSQVGLVLLMFLIGLEFDFGHLREHHFTALSISVAGVGLPFVLGLGVGRMVYAQLGMTGNRLGFDLFMATALSITAIPVLGRIMIEFNIQRTGLGALTISAAALDDATGWIILALVTAVVRAAFDPVQTAWMVVEVAAYVLLMIFGVRPLLRKWSAMAFRQGRGDLTLTSQAMLLVAVFVSAAITSLIGIFSVFGGFLMGAILSDQEQLREAVFRRLRDFVTVFFLPIFFTYTGLRTDVGTMEGAGLWGLCGLVLLAAFVGKFGGCAAAARACGLNWREASAVGIMMNARGLMELIVINVAYDLGVIPKSVFFMLVMMAIVTTYMTSPILRRLIPQTEMEASYKESLMARSGI